MCEVDLSAIASNTAVVRELLGPSVQFYAALKANAYGFGLMEVVRTVLEAGADALAMAELADACRLRDAGITAPILLYPGGLAAAESGALMQRQNIVPTVLDLRPDVLWKRQWRDGCVREGRRRTGAAGSSRREGRQVRSVGCRAS